MIATDVNQIVVFSLGESEYAVPIHMVKEIIRYSTPQSNAAGVPWIRGVINLRGSIISVCDLAMRLTPGTEANEDERSKILILESGDRLAGIIVNDVDEVRSIDPDQVDQAPASSGEFIDAVVRVEDRLVMLLDAEALLAGM
jgi:purine-binding chemotaxis protein CheW